MGYNKRNSVLRKKEDYISLNGLAICWGQIENSSQKLTASITYMYLRGKPRVLNKSIKCENSDIFIYMELDPLSHPPTSNPFLLTNINYSLFHD